jgi:hypothetical protein
VKNPGLFFTTVAVVLILGRTLGGRFLDLYNREKVIVPCLVAYIVSMAVLAFSETLISISLWQKNADPLMVMDSETQICRCSKTLKSTFHCLLDSKEDDHAAQDLLIKQRFSHKQEIEQHGPNGHKILIEKCF